MSNSEHYPVLDLLVVICSGDAQLLGHRYTLGSSPAVTTIGRHVDNTIVVRDDSVSRRHASFEKRQNNWWVNDNESKHGTFVNEKPVQRALVQYGDRIQIGDTIFKLGNSRDNGVIVEITYPGLVDGLTKAHTRRSLTEQFEQELRRAEGIARPLTLVLFDLDHFKRLNDTHGHLAGDQVLREIAELMRQHVRPGDVLARYAGDEFVLLLSGMDTQGAARLAEEIRAEAAAHRFSFDAQTIPVTIGVGVAQVNEDTRTVDDLVRSAEQMLHAARQRGR